MHKSNLIRPVSCEDSVEEEQTKVETSNLTPRYQWQKLGREKSKKKNDDAVAWSKTHKCRGLFVSMTFSEQGDSATAALHGF